MKAKRSGTRSRLAGVVLAMAILAAFPQPAPAAQEEPGPSLYLVRGVATKEERSAVAATGAGIEQVRDTAVVVRALPVERDAIAALGFFVEPIEGFFQFPPGDEAYHTYQEALAEMEAVATAHPATVHPFEFGASYQQRDLVGVRISNDPVDLGSEPGVLFVAMHHAREHLTVEVALSLVHLFAESADPAVQALVRSRQIYIIPLLNPDGAEFDIATGQYAFWRKNRQPNAGSSNIGTDLNRNYSYKWGCCGGSSGNTGSETYRGPSPFSAPETDALRQFVESHRNLRAAISYHSYGGLVLYPYGYTFTDVPADMSPTDHDVFVAMAQKMASTTGYVAQQGSDLYITDGDFGDWMYGARDIFGFTIELNDYGYGFYPPDSFIPREVEKNRDAAIYTAQMAGCLAEAVSAACTVLQATSAEPGDPVAVSATGARPNVGYGLRMGTTAANCPTGVALGSIVVSEADGDIPQRTRVVPTNTTSGRRFFCFVRQGHPGEFTTPVALTVT